MLPTCTKKRKSISAHALSPVVCTKCKKCPFQTRALFTEVKNTERLDIRTP